MIVHKVVLQGGVRRPRPGGSECEGDDCHLKPDIGVSSRGHYTDADALLKVFKHYKIIPTEAKNNFNG